MGRYGRAPVWKTWDTACGHLLDELRPLSCPPASLSPLALPAPQLLGTFNALPAEPGLQYGWPVLLGPIWFHGWLMGGGRRRWDGGKFLWVWLDLKVMISFRVVHPQHQMFNLQRATLGAAFLLYFVMLKR